MKRLTIALFLSLKMGTRECCALKSLKVGRARLPSSTDRFLITSIKQKHIQSRGTYSSLSMEKGDEFWEQQKAIMEEMTGRTEKSLRQEQQQKFADRRTALIVDNAFFSALIFSLLWFACNNPFVPLSYLFGSTFGLAYAYGLGKYVETIGGSVDDVESVQGAGVGQARFAFLILLFIFVGKLRAYGLLEIPAIMGFFTYQLASLSQGLREIDD